MSNARRLALAAAALGTSSILLVGTAGAALADNNGGRSGSGSRGPLAELVTSGTLTSADVTAIRDALEADREANREAHQAEAQAARAAVLKDLVSKGTLTQAQADAIADASPERGGMRDLITAGTVTRDDLMAVKDALQTAREADRAAHQAEMKSDRDAVLAELVSKGTITKAQADAVSTALDAHKAEKGDGPGKRGGRGDRDERGQGGQRR